MKIRFLITFIFLLNIHNIFSFTVDITPENNSIVTSLNPTISAQITSTSNTSTFIDWDNSLVGYWNFDSGNSTHAYDLSKNQNHATFPTFGNHISYSDENSVRGRYVNSSGESRYIEIEHRDYYNLYQKNTTYSFWMRPKYLGQVSNNLLSKRTGSTSGFEISLASSSNYLSLYVELGGGTGIGISSPTGTVNNNSWTHFTLTTTDQGDFYFYFNGDLNSTINDVYAVFTPPNNAENIQILFREYASFDELMIFNRTLSANEISSIYNSQVNEFTFAPEGINNLNQYNYTLYAINESGFLNISNYNFFVNYTSLNTNSLFPSQTFSSYIISILLLLMFFRITKHRSF